MIVFSGWGLVGFGFLMLLALGGVIGTIEYWREE